MPRKLTKSLALAKPFQAILLHFRISFYKGRKKPNPKQNAKPFILVLCSVHVTFLPNSVDHKIGQFPRDFPPMVASVVGAECIRNRRKLHPLLGRTSINWKKRRGKKEEEAGTEVKADLNFIHPICPNKTQKETTTASLLAD